MSGCTAAGTQGSGQPFGAGGQSCVDLLQGMANVGQAAGQGYLPPGCGHIGQAVLQASGQFGAQFLQLSCWSAGKKMP